MLLLTVPASWVDHNGLVAIVQQPGILLERVERKADGVQHGRKSLKFAVRTEPVRPKSS